MGNEVVSIIIPVYNKLEYIRKTINSILGQTYPHLEVLLIDDGSTDGSSSICNSYAQGDPRVRHILKENGGVSSARNTGIEHTKGTYVAFVDADDSLREMHIENLIEALLQNKCDVAVLRDFTIRPSKAFDCSDSITTGSRALRELMLLRFPTSTSAYLYRRATIGDTRLREDIHFFEDFLFNYEVLMKCQSLALVKENTYIYNLNETSINTSGLNDYRFSCLKIRYYLEGGSNNKKTLPPQYTFFEAHCVVSLLLAAARSTSVDHSSEIMLQESARKIVSGTLCSLFTPFSYKGLVLLCSVSPKSAIFACRLHTGRISTTKRR